MPPEQEAGRLYDMFGASLYRYALMIVANREAAEDVIQQVFVAVVSRGGRRLDAPERYLRRAVRNTCYSTLRQLRVRRTGPESERLVEALPGAAPAVVEEMRLALEAAIRELPPEQREVLQLHAFEGRTFREVAEMTGDPLNTVASRYRYAIDKLKQALA